MNVIVSKPSVELYSPADEWHPGHRPVVLTGVRWSTYEALLRDMDNRYIRLTYDRGTLEIMAPSYRHEGTAGILGELVAALAEAKKVPFINAWSTTFQREDVERALEPDRCFYIQNVTAIRGKDDIRLPGDPPPDLAIEVDIHSSCVNRLSIYAALGVPEVWRFDGKRLMVLLRRDDTGYDEVQASPTFPNMPIAEVPDLLREVGGVDEVAKRRLLRAWVRQHASPRKRAPNRRGKRQ